jgi:hypothetical protein
MITMLSGRVRAGVAAAAAMRARSSRATSTGRCEHHIHVLPARQRVARKLPSGIPPTTTVCTCAASGSGRGGT